MIKPNPMSKPNPESSSSDEPAPRRKPKPIRKWLWRATAGLLVAIVVAGVAFRYLSGKPTDPAAILAQTLALELDPDSTDFYIKQWRAQNLTILGRDDLVASIDFNNASARPPLNLDPAKLGTLDFEDSILSVATGRRLVCIMEDHLFSEQRTFIAQSLKQLKNDGFTHYSAEAIAEPSWLLRRRGYANHQTGYYTADPQFGNLIRRAIELDYCVAGYDFWPFSHDGREEFAAKSLSKILLANQQNRLLVHAGPGHVVKYATADGDAWLAARLWEKTDVEPVVVWQLSQRLGGREHEWFTNAISQQHQNDENWEFEKPVVWTPTSEQVAQLQAANFDFPDVDAIVIHPPQAKKTLWQRTSIDASDSKRIRGTWTGGIWPVVVSVYNKSEPNTAVPLDQVLLQQGETQFQLWIPEILCGDNEMEHEIRVFNSEQQLETKTQTGEDAISVAIQ